MLRHECEDGMEEAFLEREKGKGSVQHSCISSKKGPLHRPTFLRHLRSKTDGKQKDSGNTRVYSQHCSQQQKSHYVENKGGPDGVGLLMGLNKIKNIPI